MKKFLNIIVITLAINFIAIGGAVGYLYNQGRLTHANLQAIKDILLPKPVAPAATTQPAKADVSSQPMLRLEELLAKQAGRPASEQVEFIQHAFDEQLAQLERRYRELVDLQRQVDQARERLVLDRGKLQEDRKTLDTEKAMAGKLMNDKGFQDSLMLYNSMSSKQVKTIFMTLDEPTIMQYLQMMQPRTAARIIKEFKSPEEVERIQKVLERMRLAQVAVKE